MSSYGIYASHYGWNINNPYVRDLPQFLFRNGRERRSCTGRTQSRSSRSTSSDAGQLNQGIIGSVSYLMSSVGQLIDRLVSFFVSRSVWLVCWSVLPDFLKGNYDVGLGQ